MFQAIIQSYYLRRLRHGDVLAQIAATEHLGERGCKEAVPDLIAMADRPTPDARQLCAIYALHRIGDTRAVPVLVLGLATSSECVCKAALEALKQIGTQSITTADKHRIVPELLARLNCPKDERYEYVRIQSGAARALAMIGDLSATEALFEKFMAANTHPDIRLAALCAVRDMKDPKMLNPLSKCLAAHWETGRLPSTGLGTDMATEKIVIEAIRDIGDERALPLLMRALSERRGAGGSEISGPSSNREYYAYDAILSIAAVRLPGKKKGEITELLGQPQSEEKNLVSYRVKTGAGIGTYAFDMHYCGDVDALDYIICQAPPFIGGKYGQCRVRLTANGAKIFEDY